MTKFEIEKTFKGILKAVDKLEKDMWSLQKTLKTNKLDWPEIKNKELSLNKD